MFRDDDHIVTSLQSIQNRLDSLEKAHDAGKYAKLDHLGSRTDFHDKNILEKRYLGHLFNGNTSMVQIFYQKGNKYTVKVYDTDKSSFFWTTHTASNLPEVRSILQKYLNAS